MTTAVVFAYGDVGVRCLKALLSANVTVSLVVTHADDPAEHQWYGSVSAVANEYGLPCIAPESVTAALMGQVATLAPEFIFSFYYRRMLDSSLLSLARRGALNLHGSLLPRFRGRAPVNWAVLRGATQTGATLHYMTEQADAGDVVDQLAVPILRDDNALDVFRKVLVAAEIVLARSLPALINGTAPRVAQRLADGEYCGRRRPEDGRIDWTRPAREIHNLVRAVAPPFPGAFTTVCGERWVIAATRILDRAVAGKPPLRAPMGGEEGAVIATGIDGQRLRILQASNDRGDVDLAAVSRRLASSPELLPVES
jgi:methionyl-tRNA formyltransferase